MWALRRSGRLSSRICLKGWRERAFSSTSTVELRDKDGRLLEDSSRIIEEAGRLRESVQGISDRWIGPLSESTQKNTVLPFVFLLGNHSSGKSSFVNYSQTDNWWAPTDDTFPTTVKLLQDFVFFGFIYILNKFRQLFTYSYLYVSMFKHRATP